MDPAEPPLPLQHQSLLFTPLIVALSILCFAALSLVSLHLLITKLFSPSGPIARWCSMSGADKKLLESIPIHAYARAAHGASRSEDHECPVCLAAFEEGEPVRVLPGCRHVFHAACIDAWLALHSNCPLCRLRVAATDPADPVVPPVGRDIEEGGGIADASLVRSASSVWPAAAGSGLLPFREKLRLKRSSSSMSCFSLSCNSEHDAEPHTSISVSSSSL